MRKGVWMAMAALVAVTAGVTLIALPRGEAWTTSSPQALEEFEAGMEAQKKLYSREAQAHLERALELDPDFVMAKMFYLDYLRKDEPVRFSELLDEVLNADLSRLNDRERFMVERRRLLHDHNSDEGEALLDAYLADHPDDPWVLYIKAMGAWSRQENDNAERLFRQLLEISPNWVIAYNQLGYITMLQGRFVEAEEYFTSYRFIAPDQANPHDSLGELFIILGRYDEAVQSLQRAVQIKPDFWATYEHLVLAHSLMGDWAGVDRVLEDLKAVPEVPEGVVTRLRCAAEAMRLGSDREWHALVDEIATSECLGPNGEYGPTMFYVHRAACMLNDWDTATALEQTMMPESTGDDDSKMAAERGMVAAHAVGIRLARQGNLTEALTELEGLDRELTYVNSGTGILKLHNRLVMVEVLKALDRAGEAHKLLGQVRAVNPSLAAAFQEDGLEVLGIDRLR